MKLLKLILVFTILSSAFSSCMKDNCKTKARMFFPIYKTREVLLGEVKLLAPKSIEKAGKIFSYGNYLFINEIDKGIHVIDNSNAVNPNKIGFLNITGNLDLWVKNNLLYADCYDNLLVLDIKNILDIKLLETLPKVFPERSYNGAQMDETKGYVIGWIERDTTLTVECNSNGYGHGREDYMLQTMDKSSFAVNLSSSGSNGFAPPSGVAGSLTRFNVTGNYLYCVDNSSIHSFNISSQKPVKSGDVDLGWGVETIYSFNNNLFIGTSTGVLIYSLSNPAVPSYTNKMQHVRTCDPVITDGQYAFLTLRGGSACGGFTNQLDVLNVSDLKNIKLLKSYALTSPYGLGMDNSYVFICDDGYGIRVFNRADVMLMNEVKKIEITHPRDIIVLNNTLLIMAESKMLQYDYSNINEIKFISEIK